ncbi:hypothetical protein COV17_04510 [Candidatus Woesearchaeota archaeon CG10_big_fil_rev_8_21_14_0_10_36_11]|nr:MAG: hypothetical protein COV17_04510 [Candidatus Woesearchaeota archaeon CG10_big_fil_rev_8_21_14_0_10_36_11]
MDEPKKLVQKPGVLQTYHRLSLNDLSLTLGAELLFDDHHLVMEAYIVHFDDCTARGYVEISERREYADKSYELWRCDTKRNLGVESLLLHGDIIMFEDAVCDVVYGLGHLFRSKTAPYVDGHVTLDQLETLCQGVAAGMSIVRHILTQR